MQTLLDITWEGTGYIVDTIRQHGKGLVILLTLIDITREGTGYIFGTIRHNTETHSGTIIWTAVLTQFKFYLNISIIYINIHTVTSANIAYRVCTTYGLPCLHYIWATVSALHMAYRVCTTNTNQLMPVSAVTHINALSAKMHKCCSASSSVRFAAGGEFYSRPS